MKKKISKKEKRKNSGKEKKKNKNKVLETVSSGKETNRTSRMNLGAVENQQILEEKKDKKVIGYSECPECGSKNLAMDKGEVYCKDCGYVLEEKEE